MRKSILVFSTLCFVILFSNFATAALIVGTYSSTDPLPVQLGTYEYSLVGNYPIFLGSTGSITSFVSPASSPNPQWEFTNLYRTNGVPGAGYETAGNIWNIPMTAYYNADYTFHFNGDWYNGSGTFVRNAILTFDMGPDSTFTLGLDPLIGPTNMSSTSESPISIFESGTNFQVSFYIEMEDDVPADGNGAVTYAQIDINAVPVPAAVWLLGSGLIGLVGIRRRLNK